MRAMPTPSRRSSAVLLAALGAAVALAHEPGADALPSAPGWRVGGAAALLLPRADERWPTAAWPGVLTDGSAPRDQRGGLRLEHATLDVAGRLNERLGAHLALGWHDRESAHVEAARVVARQAWGDDDLELAAGRDTVNLGAVITGAGHFDRFAQMPVAKRAVLGGAWVDDGVALAWRREGRDGLRALELGAWRGRVFPGGPTGPVVPSLHLHAGWGHVDAHLGLAHWQPRWRGAAVRMAGQVGHLHGTPDCRSGLQQKVCFDGRSDVLAGSLQWEPEGGRWTFALAGLGRRERGSLYATSGDAALRSRIGGLWADAVWRPAARWSLAARLERLSTSHRLEGAGTVLLAREGGLEGAAPVTRQTAALAFEPTADLSVALEAGHERAAGLAVRHVALRAMWRQPRWLGGSW